MAVSSYSEWLQKYLTDTTSNAYAIKKQYEGQLTSRLGGLKTAYDTGLSEQNKTISQSDTEYAPLRGDAYTQNLLAQKRLKERMANMGLSATGGTSGTLENQNAMGLQSNLGSLARQKQKIIDDANSQIALLGQNYATDQSTASADIASQEQTALLAQYEKDRAYEMEQEQIKFDKAWALWQKKKITAKQFKDMTGIDVKTYSVKKASSTSSGGGIEDELGRGNPGGRG
jgi:hypothetical protein